MKLRSLLLIGFFCIYSSGRLLAQNLYPVTIGICNTEKYCMDCGAPQATVSPFTLDNISAFINYKYDLRQGAGSISFQVLVDSAGNSCVLSHTDVTNSTLSHDLMVGLNTCIWRPARVDGKRVNASVNVIFTIANGRISGKMQRMDLTELAPADSAVVMNKQYTYSNPSLKNYTFAVITKYNSPLPDNIAQASILDKTDTLWYATKNGMVKFDGRNFYPVNGGNSPFALTPDVSSMATDKNNNKWLFANHFLYMYTNVGWQVYDPAQFHLTKPYNIITPATGEVFLPNDKGLLILRKGQFRLVDNNMIWQLPSNNVYYAYYDKRGRLWVGTDRGSVMVDKGDKVTAFNKSKTPLSNTCITDMTEDDQGNLYFTLQSVNKAPGEHDEEGIAILSAKGQWSHYNTKNSGMPANKVNSMLYDKFEHVLWLAVDKAGLVRFDLKDGWENYHNNNSPIPGPYISYICQDSKGMIYAATGNGLLQMVKKK